MRVGAYYGKGRTSFTVWAPVPQKVELHIVAAEERIVPMQHDECGYWRVELDIPSDTCYFYRLNGEIDRPDPASFYQPDGVHGCSRVVDHAEFKWQDDTWPGATLDNLIIYELHVGALTPEGTFDALIERLPELRDLGVTAVELMPVAQFPGERNWGYDGAYSYAVQNSYGGPDGLKRLVQACHRNGLAAVLDVVYNHFGPEGCYVREFGPYFTDSYGSLWGSALNFDGPHSDHVRNYFIENALYWFEHFHFDALRLDAIQGILDFSAVPFLQELSQAVDRLSETRGRKCLLIAESDLNDARIIRPRTQGGYGIHAQWSDDFHHSLHSLCACGLGGYYDDFGKLEHLATALREAFVYSWKYSKYRKRRHGNSAVDRPARQFVVCSQNHDQVGNRPHGERLSRLVCFERLKLAAATVILSPYVPLLFMGEEYGEEAPFTYFVSHGDEALIEAVREGRRRESAELHGPDASPPDAQNPQTFLDCKLHWELRNRGSHATLRAFYRELLALRKTTPAFSNPDNKSMKVDADKTQGLLAIRRWCGGSRMLVLLNFSSKESYFTCDERHTARKMLDSKDEKWAGADISLPDALDDGDTFAIGSWGVGVYRIGE